MSLPLKSQQELYDLAQVIIQNANENLTDFLDGSTLDAICGMASLVGMELQRYNLIQFNKTHFGLATGPQNPGDPDDLNDLAVDQYGPKFARPEAVAAIDTVTFTRPNDSGGSVLIPAGTIVKTQPDANGNVNRYSTNAAVTMTNTSAPSDLSVSVNVTAVVAGASTGNAAAGTITVIETTLLDSTIICTNAGNSTGLDSPDDDAYLQIIYNLIQALAGATMAAIQSAALAVPGVVSATPVETGISAIAYNIATGQTSGSWFMVTQTTLYIADATGTASAALIAAVRAAIAPIKALGIYVNVAAASALTVNWTGHATLNPSGPNYSTFVNNPQAIINSMMNYINTLPTGTSFVVATANAAILAIYGPSGTNDLTAFSTSIPSGDVAFTGTQKAIAGTVALI